MYIPSLRKNYHQILSTEVGQRVIMVKLLIQYIFYWQEGFMFYLCILGTVERKSENLFSGKKTSIKIQSNLLENKFKIEKKDNVCFLQFSILRLTC